MEKIRLKKFLLLPIPAQQERHLGLKSVMFRIFIKSFKKRIFLEPFEYHPRTEIIAEHRCKTGLADSDDSFNCNIPYISSKPMSLLILCIFLPSFRQWKFLHFDD